MEAAQGSFKSVRMSKLGISPLVAAVLLIAVTMTIAGILAYWATGFVRTSLPDVNETDAECRMADFSVYSCTFDNSTKKLSLILENLQDTELTNMRLFFIYANLSVSDAVPLNTTLTAGALKPYAITGVDANFTKIMVKTHCPEISEEKVCARTG